MTTARDLCTQALDEAGVIGTGQTPLAEDINRAFTRLKQMVAAWQKNRWLVPSLQRYNWQADGSESYAIGLGGDVNIPRPSQIKGAYVIQRNTGSNPVSMPLKMLPSYEDYIRIAIKNLNSLPNYFFYDGANPLGNFFAWPIPNNQYDLHILVQSQLGFGSTIIQGSITTAGTLYTEGVYNTIKLTGGSGSGAVADITVGPGGTVTIVNLSDGGQDYAIGDVLTAAAANIGGTGSGFTWTVGNIGPTIDSEITLPPEYEEALTSNLTLRVCTAYQAEPLGQTLRLAKSSLNTIRRNATQVPLLTMPAAPGLKTGKSFNIWNADGYIFLLGFFPALEIIREIGVFIC